MRIIHTSDWHIGQRLYSKERQEEHQFFFDFLLSKISELEIDALLVSGDIFDVAYPSNSSEEIYYNFLTKLIKTNCRTIIITGGNHDSISTLNAPQKILQHLNIYIFGGLESELSRHLIHFRKDNEDCVVAAIPFLREKDLIKSVPGQTYEARQDSIRNELINLYQSVYQISEEKYNKSIKIFMGHFHTDGSLLSESEREIHFGNLGVVNAGKLPKADYWALGHIHKPQIIAGNEFIRYSGSPIPLSFSERADKKSVVLINIEDGKLNTQNIEIPAYRLLKRIKGSFKEVGNELEKIKIETHNSMPWLEIVISEEEIDAQQISDFKEYLENLKNCEVLKYKFESTNTKTLDQPIPEKLEDISADDLFNYFASKKGIALNNEIISAYKEIVQQILTEKKENA